MSKLPDPPPGELVEISGRPLSFSYWPTGRNKRRYGLRPHVFATNPWPLLTRSVREHCPKTSVPAALAFLEQAEDFYNAAHLGRVAAAKPVLLYYSFLNAVKAYILTSGRRTELDSAKHGLSEKKLAPGRKELIDAVLDAHPSSATTTNIFDDLLTIVQSTGLTSVVTIPLSALMPQIVPGHRLWASASGNVERFVAIESINFVHHQPDKELWLRLLINSGDLTRLGISHKKFLETTRMGSDWYEVKCADMKGNHKLVRFDQSNGIIYTHRAADRIQDAVGTIQHLLWRTVLIMPPYRRYYLYTAPAAERPHIFPQILSIYAIMYYLGSITRYRPHHFDQILKSEYGPFIEAFINDQPAQFIYLLASNLLKQEVTRAAIV